MWNGERYKKESGKWKYQGKAHTGTVLGHTKSGKSVYDKFDHPSHKNFDVQDHKDAAELTNKKFAEQASQGDHSGSLAEQANEHTEAALKHEKAFKELQNIKDSHPDDVDAFLDDFFLDDIDWDNEAKTKKDLRKLAYDTVTNILVDKGAIKTISDLTPEQKKKLDDYVNDEWKTYRDSLEEE